MRIGKLWNRIYSVVLTRAPYYWRIWRELHLFPYFTNWESRFYALAKHLLYLTPILWYIFHRKIVTLSTYSLSHAVNHLHICNSLTFLRKHPTRFPCLHDRCRHPWRRESEQRSGRTYTPHVNILPTCRSTRRKWKDFPGIARLIFMYWVLYTRLQHASVERQKISNTRTNNK